MRGRDRIKGLLQMNILRDGLTRTVLSAAVMICAASTDLFAQEPVDIFRQASSAVVYIASKVQAGRGTSYGSGFIVDPDGIILTSRHVVAGAREISVRLRDGTAYPVIGRYLDETLDVCLLKINAHGLPVLARADSGNLAIGEKVYTIGNPLGLAFTFSDGLVSGIRNIKGIDYVQFTAPISPGNSGGPLLNAQGQAIGIVTARTLGENLNFALAANEVKTLISKASSLKFDQPDAGSTANLAQSSNPLSSSEEYDKEIRAFTKTIEFNSDLVNAYNNRAILYIQKGNYDQAIQDLTKALELNPDFVDAYCNRSAAYIHKGDFDPAIADSSKAIQLDPGLVDAYTNRGIAYIHKGNYDSAIADCTKAIALNPALADAYNNRAIAYYRKGEYDNAWNDVHKAEELGMKIEEGFLNGLKKASNRKK